MGWYFWFRICQENDPSKIPPPSLGTENNRTKPMGKRWDILRICPQSWFLKMGANKSIPAKLFNRVASRNQPTFVLNLYTIRSVRGHFAHVLCFCCCLFAIVQCGRTVAVFVTLIFFCYTRRKSLFGPCSDRTFLPDYVVHRKVFYYLGLQEPAKL